MAPGEGCPPFGFFTAARFATFHGGPDSVLRATVPKVGARVVFDMA
jgi:hypothetical protein